MGALPSQHNPHYSRDENQQEHQRKAARFGGVKKVLVRCKEKEEKF
jgi:hypothetical protein